MSGVVGYGAWGAEPGIRPPPDEPSEIRRLRHQRIAAVYLMCQAAIALIWWGALFAQPAVRRLFLPATVPDHAILAFWLADLGLVVAGSAVAGLGLLKNDHRTPPLLWFTAGAVSYAALAALGLTMMSGEAVTGSALMLPAMVVTLAIAARFGRR